MASVIDEVIITLKEVVEGNSKTLASFTQLCNKMVDKIITLEQRVDELEQRVTTLELDKEEGIQIQ